MASSALNVLSGIAAAAAGLAGDKVSKTGAVPGLDMASIVPALLGNKTGGTGSLIGSVLSSVTKSGLLGNSKLGGLANLAGSLISFGKTSGTASKSSGGIEGLAAAIAGNAGTGAALASIAGMASNLVKTEKSGNEPAGIAASLGKALNSNFGVSLSGGATALKALNGVLGDDAKGALFKAVLKGIT